MRLIELQSSNVKRIRAIAIRPTRNVTLIGGRNGQGKSSLLDSLEYLLSGNKAIPADPVRHGEASARIVADLGELVVEKTISHKGTNLIVRTADGVKQLSPQGILDKLYSKISFDPAAFIKMKPTEQDSLLKQVVGLDLSDLDADHAKIYERRTELNRTMKQLEAKTAGLPEHKDALAAEVSVTDLMAELEKRQAGAEQKAKLHTEVAEHETDLFNNRRVLHEALASVAKLERQLVEAKQTYTEREEDVKTNVAAVQRAKEAAEAYTHDDPAEIKSQLATVEETNRQVRENADRARALAALKEAQSSAQGCSDALAGIAQQKAERLAAVKFPVEGLGFGELGPTLDGVPLEQASKAQQIRLSVAICAALNPTLRVALVREGAFLDDESMALLEEYAEEHDLQVLVERVGDRDPGAVIIEDGEVRE